MNKRTKGRHWLAAVTGAVSALALLVGAVVRLVTEVARLLA
jgi:hypothetical protein